MKKTKFLRAFLGAAVLLIVSPALAIQQDFTTMGAPDCSAGATCTQRTTDGALLLEFADATPRSGPTPSGFEVNAPDVVVSAASGQLFDATILVVSVLESTAFNGAFYTGGVTLATLDPANGGWTDVGVWNMRLGAAPVYVLLNGANPSQPRVRGVEKLRLTGTGGTTRFLVNMLNASPTGAPVVDAGSPPPPPADASASPPPPPPADASVPPPPPLVPSVGADASAGPAPDAAATTPTTAADGASDSNAAAGCSAGARAGAPNELAFVGALGLASAVVRRRRRAP